jgi:hypothetical protein
MEPKPRRYKVAQVSISNLKIYTTRDEQARGLTQPPNNDAQSSDDSPEPSRVAKQK